LVCITQLNNEGQAHTTVLPSDE